MRNILRTMWRVLAAPRALFQEVGQRGGLLVLAISIFMIFGLTTVFWSSDPGTSILRKEQAATLQRLETQLSPDQYQIAVKTAMTPEAMVREQVLLLTVAPLWPAFLGSAVLVLVLRILFLYPAVRWTEVMSVVGYCSPILVVRAIFVCLLTVTRGVPLQTVGVPQLFGVSERQESLTYWTAALLSADVFTIWWIVVLAIALGHVFGLGKWKVKAALFLTLYAVLVGVSAHELLHH